MIAVSYGVLSVYNLLKKYEIDSLKLNHGVKSKQWDIFLFFSIKTKKVKSVSTHFSSFRYVSNVLEIKFLCGARCSGGREVKHSYTPAMAWQSVGQECCWGLGSWAAPALLCPWVSATLWGEGRRQSEVCLCSRWLLPGEVQACARSEAYAEPSRYQDLCTAKQYDT